MLFTAKTLSTLEYEKIIKMLADSAATEGAKSRALSLVPTDDFDTVVLRQRRCDDAKRLINTKGYPSFSAAERVVSAAERANAAHNMAMKLTNFIVFYSLFCFISPPA